MAKKAVHFGAGNIGRGFVAEFLHNSGYEVVFADILDAVIDLLQKTPSYTVTEIGAEGEHKFTITNYRAINSKYNEGDVIKEISTADLVTCAVGPNILKFIAPVIAKGIDIRSTGTPLAVIACENAIGATDVLAGFIKDSHTPEDRRASLPERARFANSAIDRIVPGQDPEAGLNVKIESFYEWVVDKTPFKPYEHPNIKGVHWVDDLQPYIERKLFTVNTGHAAAAYHGYNRGAKTIFEALNDPVINAEVNKALAETSKLIVEKHGIPLEEQKAYVEKIIKRISNPHLEDTVVRVGRAPLRKLSRKERFIGPASQLVERGYPVDALLDAIEAAFKFQNVEGDEESVELAEILKTNSAEAATEKITGLEKNHPLFKPVEKIVERVKSGKASI
jgi:mannitol-1-phosphate 5-dehydrogenase